MIFIYRTLQKKSFICKVVHIIVGKNQFYSFTVFTEKITVYLLYLICVLVTGSGPKGRGFESRHFDHGENPGSIKLPGFFLFPARCGKSVKMVEKLGERSGWRNPEALYINGSGLGELGEMDPCCPG